MQTPESNFTFHQPYPSDETNRLYNMLYCDQLELYNPAQKIELEGPLDVLFGKDSGTESVKFLLDNTATDSRFKILAYHKLKAMGSPQDRLELLGVLVEIGMEGGLEVLATYADGTARYIHQSGQILIWEARDQTMLELTSNLFSKSIEIVNKIGPWNQARLNPVEPGKLRISFLVSDALYFGEGPMDVLFNDPMAGPALTDATAILRHITEHAGNV